MALQPPTKPTGVVDKAGREWTLLPSSTMTMPEMNLELDEQLPGPWKLAGDATDFHLDLQLFRRDGQPMPRIDQVEAAILKALSELR
jgi:hypothetical protein